MKHDEKRLCQLRVAGIAAAILVLLTFLPISIVCFIYGVTDLMLKVVPWAHTVSILVSRDFFLILFGLMFCFLFCFLGVRTMGSFYGGFTLNFISGLYWLWLPHEFLPVQAFSREQ